MNFELVTSKRRAIDCTHSKIKDSNQSEPAYDIKDARNGSEKDPIPF